MPTKPTLTASDPPGFYYAGDHNAPFEPRLVHWDGERVVNAVTNQDVTKYAVNFSGPHAGPLLQ